MSEISKEENEAINKAFDNLSRLLGDIGVSEFNLIIDTKEGEFGFQNKFSNIIKFEKLVMFGEMCKSFHDMYEQERAGELVLQEHEIDPSLKFVGIATKWYKEHKIHVTNLVNGIVTDYQPPQEDMNHPNLWKGEHWKWFLKTFMN